MTTTTTPAPKVRKPRPRPSRKVRLEGPAGARVLVITETEQLRAGPRVTVARYTLAELRADFGRGFEVRKFAAEGGNGTAHAVNVGGGPGNSDICECEWGVYGSAKPCRHVAALKSLIAAGRL